MTRAPARVIIVDAMTLESAIRACSDRAVLAEAVGRVLPDVPTNLVPSVVDAILYGAQVYVWREGGVERTAHLDHVLRSVYAAERNKP